MWGKTSIYNNLITSLSVFLVNLCYISINSQWKKITLFESVMVMEGKDNKLIELIGSHEGKEPFFIEWLLSEDSIELPQKKHRILSEIDGTRENSIDKVSEWFIQHHMDEKRKSRIEKKKKTLEKQGFQNYVQKLNFFPSDNKTIKGNTAEIILAEYLKATSGLDLLVYRLRYNPNINQSMKGDDVLLLNAADVFGRLIVGESKFREVPGKAVIEEILDNIGNEVTYPLSLLFLSKILSDRGEDEIAEELEDLNSNMHTGKTDIINVGFLLSNHNTAANVERHLYSRNPNFVLVSLGIENPANFISEISDLAIKKISEVEDES
ncbi:Hachiman antiphage defense system protein HamA [Halobacillus sp. BBL2006]|uniref:Hachiman antiphage defense system protein HamA n=1 Tax=Halobacillus sp. BBL2006 TaxID=1543706 RepID=UPI001E5E8160|nr:Hachiman antiphage defense system protein HamA [Halobacillus sp. BBL2006]